jgi:hypothetical protein
MCYNPLFWINEQVTCLTMQSRNQLHNYKLFIYSGHPLTKGKKVGDPLGLNEWKLMPTTNTRTTCRNYQCSTGIPF